MNLILDIDTQSDFMSQHGSLYVNGVFELLDNFHRVFTTAIRKGFGIISTMDWHDTDDPEFKQYPPHCVSGSAGACKVWYTSPYAMGWVPSYDVGTNPESQLKKTTIDLSYCQQYVVRKKTPSVWDEKLGNPEAMRQLISRFNPDNIYIIGVALDICVDAAYRGLVDYWRGNIGIVEDCVKGIGDCSKTLSYMKDTGAKFIQSKDL